MDTHEMLEFAAMAAGYQVFGDQHPEDGLNVLIDGRVYCWRPRHDDGDAMRLAARLKLSIHYAESIPPVGSCASVRVRYSPRNRFDDEKFVGSCVSFADQNPVFRPSDDERRFAEYMQENWHREEKWEADEYTSTRLAIFRVAVEVGRQMQPPKGVGGQ